MAKLQKYYYANHKELLSLEAVNSFYNDDYIYTPDVFVFKDVIDHNLLNRNEWYTVDIISCAAPNLRTLSKVKRAELLKSELLDLCTAQIRKVFSLASWNNVEVLVLGASSYGVFCNPPKLIAEAFKIVLDDYKYDFKVVEFAIYCSEKI